jgi:hypothetical protein
MSFRHILVVLLLSGSTFAATQSHRPKVPAPRGYFVLNDDKGPLPLPPSVYRDPEVDGVSVRAGWGTIQPQENKFVWTPFDLEIGRAKESGKKVILRIYTAFRGRRMAEWLYGKGAERFVSTETQTFVEKVGTKMSTPVPWDPIFLKAWTHLIAVFGRRYDKEPAVVMVQMAGLDYTGGEMHLPKTKEDVAHWKAIGYSKDRLVGAWRTVIDAYADAFPNKYLALDVSLPVLRDGTVEEVVAYAREKLGPRFCIQHNALSAGTVQEGFPHRWIKENQEPAIVGFQELCPVTPEGSFNNNGRRFGGTLERGLQIGCDAGMTYLEIYLADISNKQLRPTIQEFGRAMRNRR